MVSVRRGGLVKVVRSSRAFRRFGGYKRVVREVRWRGVGLKLSDCGGGQKARCERKKREIWWRWRYVGSHLGSGRGGLVSRIRCKVVVVMRGCKGVGWVFGTLESSTRGSRPWVMLSGGSESLRTIGEGRKRRKDFSYIIIEVG